MTGMADDGAGAVRSLRGNGPLAVIRRDSSLDEGGGSMVASAHGGAGSGSTGRAAALHRRNASADLGNGSVAEEVVVEPEATSQTPLTSPQKSTQPSTPQNVHIDLASKSISKSSRSSRPLPQGKLAEFMRGVMAHGCFKAFVAGAVLTNVVQLGLSVELVGGTWDVIWVGFDMVFMTIFAGEMVVKLVGLRLAYFRDRWNCFDFLLAWLGIFDTLVLPVIFKSSVSQITIIRVFRLLRLMRMVKVLTIQRQLEVLVEGLAASLKSMFWIGLLLGIIIYTCAIFCVVVIGRADYGHSPGFDNHEFFGTIFRSMLSLFNMVLLTEWAQVIRPVFDNQPACIPVFVIFVIFTTFGLLNVIIGVIVERTNEAATRLKHEDMEKRKHHQMKVVQQVYQIMAELDTNGDQSLTEQEMMLAVDNASFHGLLKEIELPKGFSVADLFLMLDQNVDRQLTGQEFADGMFRLIYSDDYQRTCMIQLTMAQLKRQMTEQLGQMRRETKQHIDNCFSQVTSEIASLRAELSGTSDSPVRPRVSRENSCTRENTQHSYSSHPGLSGFIENLEVGPDSNLWQSIPTSTNVAKTCAERWPVKRLAEQSNSRSLPRIPTMPDCKPQVEARRSPSKSRQRASPPTLDLDPRDSSHFGATEGTWPNTYMPPPTASVSSSFTDPLASTVPLQEQVPSRISSTSHSANPARV